MRFITLVCLLAALALSSGCHDRTASTDPNGSQPTSSGPSEEAWVGLFKKELAHTEQRFFQARYIQKQDDPFYLKEVLPRISADKPLTKDLKRQLSLRRDDFQQSWPLLTDQLERTQTIFAVTSVVSAFKATLVLAKALPAGLDVENAGLILKFRELVEKGTLINTRTQSMELAPELRNDVLNLAHQIAVRTLRLINAATNVSNPVRAQLGTLRNEIRLLNVQAAETAGQPVNVSEEPFIASPTKVWTELRAVYDEIFGTVADLEKVDGLRTQLAKAPTRAQSKLLRSQLGALAAEVAPNVSRLAELQAKEAKLLEQLLFATEKQFKLANVLTDSVAAK